MLSNFLIRKFIKNSEKVEDNKVRESYGYLGGIVGAVSNIVLFAIKFLVGVISGSVAVTADAFNNLSDVLSSVITIVSFKLANKPADDDHPFGHGRIEYLSALAVGCLVLTVGFSFLKSSFQKIIHPTEVVFSFIPFILLLVSCVIKIWLSFFNKNLGKKINSSALKAAGVDALSDVYSSLGVAISLLVSTRLDFPLDGVIGVIVSGLIMYSGYSILKETLNPLLGEKPDAHLVKKIQEEVLKYPHITGVHDLIIHSYGPNKYMASIHAEVPVNLSIVEIHDMIDEAEKEISKKLNVLLVIHMDPIDHANGELDKVVNQMQEILKNYEEIISAHDYRIVKSNEEKNVIFDVVVSYNSKRKEKDIDILKEKISKEVKEKYPLYNAVINVDIDYGVET